MSIIYSYPIKGAPANNDLILISDSSDSNQTKQIRVSTLPGGSSAGVSFINALNGAVTLTGGTGVTLNTVGNNIEIEAVGSGGTVTEVTTSAPLAVANGTTTPALSIALADASTDGYLSSGDWQTFNSKTSNVGTVTNITSANTALTIASPGTTPVLTSVAYSGGTGIGHVPTGSGNTATLYLDGSGNWSTPSGSASGVTSITTTDTTYIDLTPNAPSTGAVAVTAELNAVDGTAVEGSRFLTKDNTWAVPDFNTYSAGTALSLAGNVFSLANTAVTAGIYGSADNVPSIQIDAQGRITAATSVAIAGGSERLIRSVTHATTRTDPASPSQFQLTHLSSTVTAFKQVKFEPASATPATPTYNVATSFVRPADAIGELANYVKVVVKLSVLTGPSTGEDEKIMIGLHNNKNDIQGVNLSYNWQATGDLDVEIDSGDQMMQMQFTTYIAVNNLLLENGENAVAGETVYLYLKGIFDSSTPTAKPSIIIGRQWNVNPTTTAALNRAAGPVTIDVYEIAAANYSANPEFIDP
jgi:hypothetical protein